MSQHNIIGSEAFNQRPFVIIRGVKSGGFRRRRSRSVTAYVIVAVLALSAGAAVAAFALGPILVDSSTAEALPLSPISAAPSAAVVGPMPLTATVTDPVARP